MELIVSATVFTVVILFIALTWSDMQIRNANLKEVQEREFAGRGALWQLTQKSGDLASWNLRAINDTHPYSIGLADSPGSLSRAKLASMSAMNASKYENFRARLGLGKQEFYLRIMNMTGNATLYAIGIAPQADREVAVFSTFAELNRQMVMVRLDVWN